jgi:hypothetical protein
MTFVKKLLNLKCVFWFSLKILSETFPILRRIQRDININVRVYRSSCKVPVILFRFNETWIFSTDIRKILKYKNFLKICPVGTELFHADRERERERESRQTDMTKLIVAFRNFANSPKSSQILGPTEGNLVSQVHGSRDFYINIATRLADRRASSCCTKQ